MVDAYTDVLDICDQTMRDISTQERKKEIKKKKIQAFDFHYLVLNNIFQNSSYSGQRFTLRFHLTNMSQVSNVFIILWQTKSS